MNIEELAARYAAERKIWKRAGKPMRTEERMIDIHSNICSQCPFFEPGNGWLPGYDRCGKCLCNLHPTHTTLNKLAWATTHCPDNPERWSADVPTD